MSTVIREIQFKTTVRYHYAPLTWRGVGGVDNLPGRSARKLSQVLLINVPNFDGVKLDTGM